jgi:hypothetical protein
LRERTGVVGNDCTVGIDTAVRIRHGSHPPTGIAAPAVPASSPLPSLLRPLAEDETAI